MYDIKERFLKSKLFWIIVSSMMLLLAAILLILSFNRLKPHTSSDVVSSVIDWDYCQSSDINRRYIEGLDLIIGTLNDDWELMFYEYVGGERKVAKKLIEAAAEDDAYIWGETTEKNGFNYNITETYSTYDYMLSSRVANTLLYIGGPKEDEDDIKELAIKLGYYKE